MTKHACSADVTAESTLNLRGEVCSLSDIESIASLEAPEHGRGAKGLQSTLYNIAKSSINTSSPGFLDKLYSSPSAPGIAADLVLSVLNNNSHVWHVSPGLVLVEKYVARELARLFGLQGHNAGGVTVPGGAAANMTALLVARNFLCPSSKNYGIGSYGRRLRIFVSEAAHYSIANAAQVLGFGRNAVVQIPSDDDGAMLPDALRSSMEYHVSTGAIPLFVAATAGTTVKGAFDPLNEIGAIAREYRAWYHIDACWGGAAVFSERLRHRLSGSAQADTISFNPHKMLGVPLICSFLLARDLRTLWCANRLAAGYLFHDDYEDAEDNAMQISTHEAQKPHDECPLLDPDWRQSEALSAAPKAQDILDLASLTPQCGRRPDALKLYAHWNYYGTEGLAKDVERAVESATYLASLIAHDNRFLLLGDVKTSFAQVCFYYVRRVQAMIDEDKTQADHNSSMTRKLSQALLARGWMVDFAPGNGRAAEQGDFLRVVCNRQTTKDVVAKLFETLQAIVSEFETSDW